MADAVKGNWVDTHAPEWSRPYLRLSRADRPIGTWLLYIPCIWGVLLAAMHDGLLGLWDAWIILGCGLGAWLMRGAGCSWNDITDREFDAKVARTQSRPIPSGQVNVKQALAWMALQAGLAFLILITFGMTATIVGVTSLLFVAIYPFAKRFTWWPQVFLGLAFNWGALVGWTAHSGQLEWPALILYIAGIVWTLFYDTIYAHQDTEDDALIGIKSTARLFGDTSPKWLWSFALGSTAIFMLAVFSAQLSFIGTIIGAFGILGFFAHMAWQMRQLNINDPDGLLQLFRSNRNTGLIPCAFFLLVAFL